MTVPESGLSETTRRRWWRVTAVAFGFALVAAACGDAPPATRSPEVRPATTEAAPSVDAGPATSASPTGTADLPTPAPPSGEPSASAGPAAQAFRTIAIHLVPLPMSKRFYTESKLAPLRAPGRVDDAGVPLDERHGKPTYHPVLLDERALHLLDSYRQTGNARYLKAARAIANRLVLESRVVAGARYLPYRFDFALHGRHDDVLEAPWYSGMAEGMALSVFTRLHAIEGKPDDLAIAASFEAALRPHGRTGPWVTYVGSHGYLWIEEYPGARPDHTLNGFNFALFGLYDYAIETGDPEATQLFIGGLTTVIHYLPEFRNPGSLSKYCLRHAVVSAKYHGIHVAQLKELARMTESPVLARYARLFAADGRS